MLHAVGRRIARALTTRRRRLWAHLPAANFRKSLEPVLRRAWAVLRILSEKLARGAQLRACHVQALVRLIKFRRSPSCKHHISLECHCAST